MTTPSWADDDEVCSPGFTCEPGDDDELCPEGSICEFECDEDDDDEDDDDDDDDNNDDDDDDGLPDCELKECELNGIADGDDIDDGICVQQAGPCAGLGECPCDYDNVIDKDILCWEECPNCVGEPFFNNNNPAQCNLNGASGNSRDGFRPFIRIFREQGPGAPSDCIAAASTAISGVTPCSDAFVHIINLTTTQLQACECRVEQYTKELIRRGITVVDSQFGGTPLTTDDISCNPE